MAVLLLEARSIRKSYGERALLNIDHLSLYEGDRVGLVGENGAGKSTLLSILAGEAAPDGGEVRRCAPVAVIRQSGDTAQASERRLRAEFRAPDAHPGLSGGEETRRRIAAALSQNAPILMADEPTSDLDLQGVERLRQRLSAHRGALLLISHDRDLLESLCNRVWHLEDGGITDFPGRYSEYQAELARRREFQQFEYDQYRAERARLKAAAQKKAEWAASVRKAPKRMGNSEARLHTRESTNAVLGLSQAKRTLEDRAERLEKKERPRDLPEIRMTLGAAHPIQAKTALTVRCRALSAGGRTLIAGADFTLPTGSRTALLGENGCGKTTLLRALTGETAEGVRFDGQIRFNPAARFALFDQNHARALRMEWTALENVLADSAASQTDARTVLARLNVKRDDVFKRAGVLSGGEQAKVALAKLMLSDANLLILDEPTNHLDLFTLEALEALLSGYGGTLLFVSHDRAFVGAVATRLLRVEGGALRAFEGTLSQYEASLNADRAAQDRQLEITALEMRLAALAGRMAAPKKGERPEALSAEYDRLAAQLREMKHRL